MQKSGFAKMRHYVGFWQIGSHIATLVHIISIQAYLFIAGIFIYYTHYSCVLSIFCILYSCKEQGSRATTYTRQERSTRLSTNSNSWLMSYVMEGLCGCICRKCSSYILQIPKQQSRRIVQDHWYTQPTFKTFLERFVITVGSSL